MEHYIDLVEDKSYGISVKKLTKEKSIKYTDNDMSIAPDRTFFCSELIAKAYKCLGFIEDNGKSSAKFYPKHFSNKGDEMLEFKNWLKLKEEQRIILEVVNLKIKSKIEKKINAKHKPDRFQNDGFDAFVPICFSGDKNISLVQNEEKLEDKSNE